MRKILVINMNYLGDALFTTPALESLRLAYPTAVIDTIVGPGPATEVLRGNPSIDNVITRQARGGWGRFREMYGLLRRGRYDGVVILPTLPIYAAAAFLAGTPTRVGLARKGMTRFLTHPATTSGGHQADQLLDVAAILGVRPEHPRLIVAVDREADAFADRLLCEVGVDVAKPLIALNMGATKPQNRWFPEQFAATVQALSGVQFLLIGHGPDDAAMANSIISLLPAGSVMNLVGRTSVHQLAAVLKRVDVLVSCDTGPMHLATAVGTPLIALFGPADESFTGPYTHPRTALVRSEESETPLDPPASGGRKESSPLSLEGRGVGGEGYPESAIVINKHFPCAPCGKHPTCGGRYGCMRAITAAEVADAARTLLRIRRVTTTLPMA